MSDTKELIGKKVKGARGEGTIIDIDVKGNIVELWRTVIGKAEKIADEKSSVEEKTSKD